MKTKTFSGVFLYSLLCTYSGFSQSVQVEKTQAAVLQSQQIEHYRNLPNVNRFRITDQKGYIEKFDINVPLTTIYPKVKSSDEFSNRFLKDNDQLLRINNASINLRFVKRYVGPYEFFMYQQEYMGYPVYGSWLKLNYGNYKKPFLYIFKPIPVFIGVSGRYLPDMNFTVPKIKIDTLKAVSIIKDSLEIVKPERFRMFISPKLWIYNHEFLKDTKNKAMESNNKLAWRIVFASADHYMGSRVDAFVDAETGKILDIIPRTSYVDIDIENANNSSSTNCWSSTNAEEAWFDEDGRCSFVPFQCTGNLCADGWNCASPNQEGRNTYEYSWDILHFFDDVYGMDSYDDDGEELETYLNVIMFDQNGNIMTNAASSDCGTYSIHQFSTGMAVLDVYSHEVGHSFHLSVSGFKYENRSGAIAEHVADAMGIIISNWTGKDQDWTIGEDCAIGTIRDVQNPRVDCDENSEYNEDICGVGLDNGCVHANANILNHFFYLMTAGGDFNGYSITGIGLDKARVIYKILVYSLPDEPNFETFRDEVLLISYMLTWDLPYIGRTLTNTDYCNVRNALAAIGLTDGDNDCDGVVDPVDNDDDNDGLTDDIDKCPEFASYFNNNDLDNDGIGDVCDDDIDGDGINNENDNCIYAPNSNQLDSDWDGIGNSCDNCPNIANADQFDMDGDNIGDVCDDDRDGDGFPNSVDKCPDQSMPSDGVPFQDKNGCWTSSHHFDVAVIPGFESRVPAFSNGILNPVLVIPFEHSLLNEHKGVFKLNEYSMGISLISDATYSLNYDSLLFREDSSALVQEVNKSESKMLAKEFKKYNLTYTPDITQPFILNIGIMDSYGNLVADTKEYLGYGEININAKLVYKQIMPYKISAANNTPYYLVITPKINGSNLLPKNGILDLSIDFKNTTTKYLKSGKLLRVNSKLIRDIKQAYK